MKARPEQNTYLHKHRFVPAQLSAAPNHSLKLVVVIPCHDEPNLLITLDDLWACDRPADDVEILIVINGSEADPAAVRTRNRATLTDAQAWISRHQDPQLRCHVLYFPELPPRHAGVGLARKIGMDEAVARFNAAGNPDGIIACLDADCRCQRNYLTSLCQHFETQSDSPGCSIFFEHPVDELKDHRARLGMARYELYLRYFIHGLRYAGFPYAYQTVGSCMAVRCRAYEKQGGMNRRQAGEDFYFLHKIIALGGFTELTGTTVIPAARCSNRVPFGTGQTLRSWVGGCDKEYPVYAPQVFSDLKTLFDRLEALYRDAIYPHGLAQSVMAFLGEQDFPSKLAEIRANTASPFSFRKRFWHWFGAFRTLKYVHHATAHTHARVPVEQAAQTMLQLRGLPLADDNAKALLQQYRRLDRYGCGS